LAVLHVRKEKVTSSTTEPFGAQRTAKYHSGTAGPIAEDKRTTFPPAGKKKPATSRVFFA
jgi:hypothetical protein